MSSTTFAGSATLTGPERLPKPGVPQVIVLYRVVVGFIIASLLWKCSFYPAVYTVYTQFRMEDDFFPRLMSSTLVLVALLLTPVALGMIAMFVRRKWFMITQATVTAICMFGMCIHQGSYNDVTFLTCFWVSLWCIWYTIKIGSPEKELISQAKKFAILIISLIFFGGTIGKLTPGYWSGQVLYEIYFIDRDFWIFNLLRANFEPETLRDISTYYSRMIILAESACALLWLLPSKIAGGVAMTVLLGIVVFSNEQLLSVMFCLVGLTIVALHDPKPVSVASPATT
ncbi:MAG: hypothetical protein P8J27_06350 [Mariniblastus sp.]|nr:hypothetical protein [Mariniblastus sp.]